MTETKNINGLIKVKREYGPSFGDVLFSWFFYGLFRMTFYRFLLPWSFFGIVLNYILLFTAISLTIRAMFSPRYIYSIETEVEPQKSSETHTPAHEDPTSSPKEQDKSKPNEQPEHGNTATEPTVDSTPLNSKTPDSPSTSNQVKYCSSCGVENQPHARYCYACGEKFERKID